MTADRAGSPAAQGFRLPAEWEPHAATWLGWPANRADWPGKFAPIPWVYGEIVRKLAPGEICRIIAQDRIERQARRLLARAGVDPARVEFFDFPSDRGWTRDSGPVFLKREGPPAEVAVAGFRFNAWAKYPDWARDAEIPARAAERLGLRRLTARIGSLPFVLEGGSIDVNGVGALLTTEECLLDPAVQVRNPGFTRADYEAIFRQYLGIETVIWLGAGIAGDDTHGHVDDLCRFVKPDTVVLCQETNSRDANHRALAENRGRLEGARLAPRRAGLHVAHLPMPAPLTFDGHRLPASYANFYIGNGVVLVPTFNDANDRIALGILAELFPDRRVLGIHALDLVWGLGTIHCLTHEVPAAPMA